MFDMLVEQSSRVTSVSSPQGSHHLTLNHTTHLSPRASHSSSDSSSPRSQHHDDSSTTSSSTPLKLNGESGCGGEEEGDAVAVVEPSNNNNNNTNSQSDNFSHIQRLQFAFEKNSVFANYFGAKNNTNNNNNNSKNNSSNTNLPSLPASLNRHQLGQLESKILTQLSLPLGSPSPQSSHITNTSNNNNNNNHKMEGDEADHFEMETEEHLNSSNENENHFVHTPTTSPTDSTTNAANIFQCPLCTVSCTSRQQFNEHLVSHSQHQACPKCTFLTTDEDMLRSHLQEVHDVNEAEAMTDDEVRVPKVNSQGKVKTLKCKACDYTTVTKADFWEHQKLFHIRKEKMLTCPKCPFVTEFKHHFEYHLRNHLDSKPFQCNKCAYSCVNKSMLNSHLKSHSNVYQYRCADCSYATKYCHSLKLHLRKYCHNPSVVLNLDGTPNPLPIIDVYGTRRGPKIKKSDSNSLSSPADFNQLNNNNNSSNSTKKRSNSSSNINNNNNNSSSGDDGHSSPRYIKREYREETPPKKFAAVDSASDNESDSETETTSNYHRSILQHHHLQQQQQQHQQQQQQQHQLRRHHQMPETPITPSSLALQGLFQNSLVVNGQHVNEQQQQQIAAAVALAAGNVKNPMDFYAAFNQYFLMNPLLHMAQQQQHPFSDLATKFGQQAKEKQNPNNLTQILNQSPMMPRNLSVSPPLLNHRGQGPTHQAQKHTSSSTIERDHHAQTPLDLRNPKTSPIPYETPPPPVADSTEKSRKSRKVKPMRYDRKLLHLDPLNLSDKIKEECDQDEQQPIVDSNVVLDFSNNNVHTSNNSSKKSSSSSASSWNVRSQLQEPVRPSKMSPSEPMMCKYCEISFPDRVLYSMHMNFHSGDKNPFLCKGCGKHTKDKTSFFRHLAQEAH